MYPTVVYFAHCGTCNKNYYIISMEIYKINIACDMSKA